MKPLKYIPQYTYEDYCQWEGNWELIDGLPYAMSPSPIRKHQRMGGVVFFALEKALSSNSHECGKCVAIYETDWIISQDTIVRPDLAIVCTDEGEFIKTAPVVVVEILSPSTAMKDRIIKKDIYEREQVPYYIIIDPEKRILQILVWKHSGYEEDNDLKRFDIHGQCSIEFDLAEVVKQAVL